LLTIYFFGLPGRQLVPVLWTLAQELSMIKQVLIHSSGFFIFDIFLGYAGIMEYLER